VVSNAIAKLALLMGPRMTARLVFGAIMVLVVAAVVRSGSHPSERKQQACVPR
jgi:hypothetical protein